MFKHSLLFHAVTGTTGTDPGSSTDVSKIGGWSENVYADVSYLNNRGTPQPSLVALLSARAHVLSKNCSIVGVRVGEVTVGTRTVKAKGRSIVGRVLYAGSFGNTIDTPSAGIQLACNTNQGNALSYKLKGCPDDAFTHGELNKATANDAKFLPFFTALGNFKQIVTDLNAASQPIVDIRTEAGVTTIRLEAALAGAGANVWVTVLRTRSGGRPIEGGNVRIVSVTGTNLVVDGWQRDDAVGGQCRIDAITSAAYDPALMRVVGRCKATIGKPHFLLGSRR